MTFKIHQNVKIGKNCQIGDFAIIGLPPKGHEDGQLETIIGDDSVIRSHTVIYAGNKIGNSFQIGHNSLVRESNIIGDNVSIGSGSVVEHSSTIKDNVRLHSQCFVPEYSTLDEGAWLGPYVVLTNAMYPKSAAAKENLRGPYIGKNAKIGAHTTILPGVNIGDNSLVGAGSVVTKDVLSGIVVAGNPAKKINEIKNLPYDV